MEDSSLGGGFLSGSSGRLPMHKCQQGQMVQPLMPQQAHHFDPLSMMSGLANEQPLGFGEAKELTLGGMCMDFGKGKGISLGPSCSNNTTSEDDELSLKEDGNGENSNGTNSRRKRPWQRMKWTDDVIRLLIAVVASVGDDCMQDAMDGLKRKSGMLHKKGKWKMVSKIMISKGCCVSPQQCEDKFNDLNKRYKKLNDILGRGTCCQVVENPSLMDCMPHLTAKAKDEVKRILNSKHLFYREMCAYHNGHIIPGCHDIDLHTQISADLVKHPNGNDVSEEQEVDRSDESDDDDSDDNTGKNVEANTSMMEAYYGNSNFRPLPDRQDRVGMELAGVFQDLAKSPEEQRAWVQQQMWQLEEQKVKLQAEALDLEKERFKWLRFRAKKDRELKKLSLENERMKFENDRMVLLLKKKGLELGISKSETSPEQTSLSIHGFHGRDEINLDRHQ